jgi:hypothetical protein
MIKANLSAAPDFTLALAIQYTASSTKATGDSLSHLEEAINGFNCGISQAGFQIGEDAGEVFFESSREFAEGFESAMVGPAQPPAEGRQVAIGQHPLASRKAMARPSIG